MFYISILSVGCYIARSAGIKLY